MISPFAKLHISNELSTTQLVALHKVPRFPEMRFHWRRESVKLNFILQFHQKEQSFNASSRCTFQSIELAWQ